ncbi:tumor necrosis factor receptor superfamily member 5-like protein [Labeo rohita]|uniref:Tumor necrosis factor receptor superfamily member 5-like protein n=1 Tax=Labeo rohita TaxID=84645 RepID=A0A498LNI9_LABRO|nr:tumor necrosis factor receptor superfamily member 5-like protein [Labeo rohita]
MDGQFLGASHIMDGWKTTGKTIRPQLVVKIVGGKQIKYFADRTESPTDHLEVTNCSEDRRSPPNRVMDRDLSRKSPSYDLEHTRPDEQTENLLHALRQTEEWIKSSPEFCLLSSISEELQDLEPQTFQTIEEEVTSLDPTRSGNIRQSELTYLFLKLKLPLKLTTLACMFKTFSDATDPEQVHYDDLLQFMQKAIQEEKQQSVQAEIWDASVSSTDLESVSDRSDVNAEQRETWFQRFQKMEMALQMCDTKNTGYVDRDQAKRLIQNYSLIFDLNLSPHKVTLLYLVSCCELKTHYMKDDKCCKKCGPGKRMLVDDNCEDPRCQDCKDGEYQDDYTSKTKCERQPSCDTNLHFKPHFNPSTTEKIKCQCEDGYYCMNDDDCDVCRKHTVCKPGQRVIKKGYKWWTELPKQAEKITGLGIRRLHEDTDVEKAHHPLRQQQPEEDYDDSTPVSPTPSNMTDNGHPVQQEHGKESVSSHPETNSSL